MRNHVGRESIKWNRFVAALALLCSFSWAAGAQGLPADTMRVHFIDVGQGDATLLEFSCGVALVDTGGERWPAEDFRAARYDSSAILYEYLDEFFRSRPDLGRRIDVLFLTHPHKDHTRGTYVVVDEFAPLNLVHNGQSSGSGIDGQNYARDYARRNDEEVSAWYVLEDGIPMTGLQNDTIDALDCAGGDPDFRVLWGQVRNSSGWSSSDYSDENNHSVVVRVDFGESSLLFPGDLEERYGQPGKAGIERLVEKYQGGSLLDVDILHIGHHGSHNGNSDALMQAATPEVAVFSSGPACPRPDYSAWQHAHPRKETLDEVLPNVTGLRSAAIKIPFFPRHESEPELRSTNKAVYGTAWDGHTVLTVKLDGSWSEHSLEGPPRCLEDIAGWP